MLRAHARELPPIADLSDGNPDEPAPRLAVAGGSDSRPPDERGPSGQVVPFPRERVRPATGEAGPAEPSPAGSGSKPPRQPDLASAAGEPDEPLWPGWMAHVLTRYRTPEGGRGPSGIFI